MAVIEAVQIELLTGCHDGIVHVTFGLLRRLSFGGLYISVITCTIETWEGEHP